MIESLRFFYFSLHAINSLVLDFYLKHGCGHYIDQIAIITILLTNKMYSNLYDEDRYFFTFKLKSSD